MKRFTTEDTERGLGVTCPYRDCGGRFIVNKTKWLRGLAARKVAKRVEAEHPVFDHGHATARMKTRCCPYCFRVSLLP